MNSFLIYKEIHHLPEERHVHYRNNLIAQLVSNIHNSKAKWGRMSGHDVAE